MVRHIFKTVQHLLQDFQSMSDHFGTLCIKELRITSFFIPNFEHLSPRKQRNEDQ